ncbi:MAG: hypothetical protein KME32_33375 [Mojavia pulchra JT2-VF2]|jgi:uncharacterized membrane protein YeaQ/YmgE (transglycosylase-associated protein family)|uniref:Uncharacterized protein n=1 Tax=Mojavia pulchra JT2-VF2 TaxID=287848 RepID=A0A951UKB7_9NOST|nr:hypothetical protein [Mojavia pulchra JT2-VF2]
MTLHKNQGNGYLAAIAGGVIGAVALMNLGVYLGITYVKNLMPNAELEGVIPPSIGYFVGWWIGAVFGCWLVLRWRKYRRATKTAQVLAILAPLGIIVSLGVYSTILNLVRSGSSIQIALLYEIVRSITVAGFTIPLVWLARFLSKPRTPYSHQ